MTKKTFYIKLERYRIEAKSIDDTTINIDNNIKESTYDKY